MWSGGQASLPYIGGDTFSVRIPGVPPNCQNSQKLHFASNNPSLFSYGRDEVSSLFSCQHLAIFRQFLHSSATAGRSLFTLQLSKLSHFQLDFFTLQVVHSSD